MSEAKTTTLDSFGIEHVRHTNCECYLSRKADIDEKGIFPRSTGISSLTRGSTRVKGRYAFYGDDYRVVKPDMTTKQKFTPKFLVQKLQTVKPDITTGR